MAFQDRMRDNFCFGCGADNPAGLLLRSDWDGDEPAVAADKARTRATVRAVRVPDSWRHGASDEPGPRG